MEDGRTNGAESVRPNARILLIDDDALVLETFASVLGREGYDVHTAASVSYGLTLLRSMPFDIMFCDLMMPEMNGLQLLDIVQHEFVEMPVIIVTGYASRDMAREALNKGACDYVTKPCRIGELPIVVERNLARHAMQRKHMLRYRLALQTSNESILDALLSALDTRDTETQGHSERVTAYTMEIADIMSVGTEDLYHIERGALLHDIGKIGIPDRILLKPAGLTPEEWVEMRKHPLIGYQMCARIEMLKQASEIVLHHHEAWNGAGYPYGLAREDISLGARIFAVADTLDAITSDRPYRAAQSYDAARAEILRFSGTQFDPQVVDVYLSVPEARWQQIRTLAGQ